MHHSLPSGGGGERHSDSLFGNQECRLGSSLVREILCDHTEMSQAHEILPGIVAYTCYGRGGDDWVVGVYHKDHSAGNDTGTPE